MRTCVASRLTYDEELFGPVAAIISVQTRPKLSMWRRSIFGLGAAVFMHDKAKGERLEAQELRPTVVL